MSRVPVLSKSGKPLMPTKASRARRWLKEGKAKVVHNNLACFVIQLTFETEENTQPIALGIDPAGEMLLRDWGSIEPCYPLDGSSSSTVQNS